MKSFVAKIAGVSVALAVAGWLVFSLFLPGYYLPVLPWMLLFFLVITLLVHAWQLKLIKKDMGRFARSNMLVTFFKLMIYSVFAVVYIASDKENALVFVVCLALVYFIFSFVEVSEITRIVRKK
jgi:hypothetical protein